MTERLPPLNRWVAERPAPEVEAALARLREAPDVAAIAVMPDVHLASEVCVGVAVATHARLYPAAVGSDIGCGMAALAFDKEAAAALARGPQLLAALGRAVPVIRHPRRRCPPLPEDLAERPLSASTLERAKHEEGALQLGSLGRGNHFVELQRDDHGQLWAMVHTGSRGLGQRIRKWHEARANPAADADTQAHAQAGGLPSLDADSPAGRAYLSDLEFALAYADHNRERILAALTDILADTLGAQPLPQTKVSCQHNFVRREHHVIEGEGRSLWVHRKGAISAGEGELGIIPGSMGSCSYLVEGRGEPDSLCSSSHGAGRALARGEAFRSISTKQLRRELRGVCFDERLAERLRDEAPGAYKDIGAVMRAQRELTRILERLQPLLVFKGG
ncbi:RtcB family protein [Pseudenhygromyxa sp. WMMC2535]|uniref:RtcB family protein n=1 Tax=Pseudenhygromyxa sp. WMMC2535 TaxID=2712867 RepID=UPI00155730D8|nr:RtcB family protein [Pseudenhygromyxa sp. WMMC2535]NVB43235.1 RtcB family protein [Pseudenhygromyxa sp. WMMC2535]